MSTIVHRALIVLAAVIFAGLPARAQEAPVADQQARFAFVVGSDGYEGAELPTAANDAALVADMLKSAGFAVTGARNLDQDTLRSSYREFVEKVAAAGEGAVAYVYLSGYGVQLEGENWLIPVGARVERAADLSLNAVRLTDFTRALSGLPLDGRILVFDLAHAQKFLKDTPPGLAIMDAEPGEIIAFNASPGVVAPAAEPPYGPYAQALAEMSREAGLPLADVFARVGVRVAEMTRGAQVPWRNARLEEPLILFQRGPEAPAPQVTAAEVEKRRAQPLKNVDESEAYALALDRDTIAGYEEFLAAYPRSAYAGNVRNIVAKRREAITWRRTVQVNTPAAYWSYLDRYPRGPNAAAARARLARLSAAATPPPRFDVIEYDVLPPPREELVYFVDDRPSYFEIVEAPIQIVYIAPRPLWWRPPPPPIYVVEDYYYLPAPVVVVERPIWVSPPVYVAPPPPPVWFEGPPAPGFRPNPYVAIPAAVAAGIVAGKLIGDRRRPIVGPAPRPGVAPGPRPFIPPVAAPARPRPVSLPGQPGVRPESRPRPGVRPPNPDFQPQTRPTFPGQQTLPTQKLPPPTQGFMPGQRPGLRPEGTPAVRPDRPGVQQPGVRPGVAPDGQRPGARPDMRPGVKPEGLPSVRPSVQQPGVRPGIAPDGQRPGVRPDMRPGVKPEGLPAVRPGVQQPGVRPGIAPQQGQRPGVRPDVRPSVQQPGVRPGVAPDGQRRQQQLQQQQQQQRQQQIQQQRQQEQSQQRQQQIQQQRQQQQQLQRQQQMQQQRQEQQSQQRQQQLQQQRSQQDRQRQLQQRMEQQQVNQRLQQQRMQQQQMQQRQQQQRMQQQQMQQRQQQQQMQQRQQQQMQQRQQQQIQQRQQQQRQQQPRRACGGPGQPRC